jgi:adenylate kinase family enzyme
VGASGSGTSTLAAALGKRLGIAHLDTDDYYWLPTDPPFEQARPTTERLTRHRVWLDALPCLVARFEEEMPVSDLVEGVLQEMV